ncbi:pentatricopeptide repeat-containing protein, mitochondrial [Heracleum sosnowskyi]|uniref:Pentatricopeptide repeat-containing protein, mitochondrial n=1 Tax=Heracleum sosnowskyi TaxID=360622 RepID=A0AAD8HCC7_9APIA|nr:pentatricopeptide repeat-containing protein, mitochondrial [Heracleum sosnowskyi]
MATANIVRRLQRTQSHLFLSHVLTPIKVQNISRLSNFFIQAFHQTPLLHSRSFTTTIHSGTRQVLKSLSVYEVTNFTHIVNEDRACHQSDVNKLCDLMKQFIGLPSEEEEAITLLDDSGVEPNESLVYSVIWEFREDWKISSLLFKWGEKWKCNGGKNWSLIVWVLGNHKKFNIAWCVIRDMHRSSLDTRKAMLIMIDRYAAANEPVKAIEAFKLMEKFRLTPDMEALYTLLYYLCKNGNIEEAEEFMLLNKKLFPLEVDGFNIILNGWCNISLDVFEAKRVWREMSKCCILPNETSYTCMISCFSKMGNLFDSLRLYDEMKKRDWVPGIEVYNSLIYVLTSENCLNEAYKIVEKMKELGLRPDSTTYNSMICPLCEATKLEEARKVLARMVAEKVSPSIETYHAFLDGTSLEGTLEVLNHMSKACLGPTSATFLTILAKFFKKEHPESALKIWVEMTQYKVVPDSTHYSILIEGLTRFGFLGKARQFYTEMTFNGIRDDPKLKNLLKLPGHSSSHQVGQRKMKSERHVKKPTQVGHSRLRKHSLYKSKRVDFGRGAWCLILNSAADESINFGLKGHIPQISLSHARYLSFAKLFNFILAHITSSPELYLASFKHILAHHSRSLVHHRFLSPTRSLLHFPSHII